MRVIGLGWEDLITHWSNNGNVFTTEELESHLKMIVSTQRPRSIPTNIPVLLPVQKALPQHGTQAPEILARYAAYLENSDEFEHQERHTRLEKEAVGISNRYSNIQPTSVPYIENVLIGKQMDVFLHYFLYDGGTELCWIQGEVILVSYGTKITNNQGRKA